MGRSRARAGAPRPICHWSACRRARSSGWRARYAQIEDILPLSPLQEGLLFHALYDEQAPDVYTVQLMLELEGPLDRDVLQAAVQALLERHGDLRAAFLQTTWPAGAGHRVARDAAVAQRRSVSCSRRRSASDLAQLLGRGSA